MHRLATTSNPEFQGNYYTGGVRTPTLTMQTLFGEYILMCGAMSSTQERNCDSGLCCVFVDGVVCLVQDH